MRRAWPWLLLASLGCGGGGGAGVGGDTDTDTGVDPTTGAGPDGPPDLFGEGVLNIAHRGGKDEAPENTLVAFEHALEVGAHVLELDVHGTADGAVVVIHDDTVDRTTDGTGAVADLTLAQIQAMDAGYRFSPDGGATHPWRGMGVVVPTLPAVLDAFPDALFAVEIKPASAAVAEAVAQSVADRGMVDQVFVWSSEVAATEALRSSAADLHVGLTFGEQVALDLLAPEEEAAYVPPGPFAQIAAELNGFGILDQALTEKAGRVGIIVHAWTVNDEAQMLEVIDWGVDGIITDRPSTLAPLLD